jgi:hypothetical protein
MESINHQLLVTDFFIPQWPIKYLFIGTFNPEGGKEVKYYYGRDKNQTWNILSDVFSCKLYQADSDFMGKIQNLGIGCVDLIKSVEFDESLTDEILGKGYKDSKIINNRVVRHYNTNKILELIESNPGVKMYSTWGKGSNLKDWYHEVVKLGEICNLASPSLAARVPKGVNKYNFILNDWKSKIKPI